MGDPALSQLIDMGIPVGRARAALKRSKGDAMSAAVSHGGHSHVNSVLLEHSEIHLVGTSICRRI